MAEQYDVAAWRHQRAAEALEGANEYDDAAYHYGLVGETAIKHALRASGCEAAWLANRTGKTDKSKLRDTPMRAHVQDLAAVVTQTAAEIALFATGRLAQPITLHVLSPSFQNRFKGWHIDIRYADPTYTPVTAATLAQLRADAADLLLHLVV